VASLVTKTTPVRGTERKAWRVVESGEGVRVAMGAKGSMPIIGCMEGRPVDRYLVTLRQHLPELAEKYRVRSLEVFGSYVRNEQTPDSDLDVLVTFDKAPGLFQFIELENFLSDALGIKVDLVMKSALKPRIGPNILREAVPV